MADQDNDTLLRMFAMLRVIPRYPQSITARDLLVKLESLGYSVNVRTVQRDLNRLSRPFALSSTDGSGPQGAAWFWAPDYELLDIPGMTPDAAIALLLSESHLAPQLPTATLSQLKSYFGKARDVLDALPNNALSRWRHKVRVIHRGPPLKIPQIKPEVHQAVYEALLGNRMLAATYRRRGAGVSRNTEMHPVAIVIKDHLTYLVATEWDYTDQRHYPLHRFDSASVLDRSSKAPPNFDLDAFIHREFSYPVSPATIDLVLAVEAHVADHVEERPLSPNQLIDDLNDGRKRLRASVADTAELRWWLQGFGAGIEVLGPKTLRSEFRSTVRALAERYRRRPRSVPAGSKAKRSSDLSSAATS